MRPRSLFILLALLFAGLPAPTAFAQSSVTAVVPLPGADPAVSISHAVALMKQMNARSIPVIDGALARRRSEPEAVGAAREAVASLSDGEAALDGFELDQAIERLGASVARHRLAMPYFDLGESYLRALLLSASANLIGGDLAEEEVAAAARDAVAWRRAAGLEPPTSAEIPNIPDEIWSRVKAADEPGRGRVIVRAPAAASVYFNWRPAGVAPLTREDLPYGKLLVQVTRPGYKPFSEWVTVKEEEQVVVEARLVPDDDQAWFEEMLGELPSLLARREADPLLDDLQRWTTADALMVVLSCGDTVEGHWYAEGAFQKRLRQSPDPEGPNRGKAFALSLLRAGADLEERDDECEMGEGLDLDLGLASESEIMAAGTSRTALQDCWSGSPCPDGNVCELGRCVANRPIYKEWWFLTLLGAAAVGAAVTTTVIVMQPDDNIVRVR